MERQQNKLFNMSFKFNILRSDFFDDKCSQE